MDWNKRINELNRELTDFWQNLYYTTSDAIRDNKDSEEYSKNVIEQFLSGSDLYDAAEKKYITEKIKTWVDSEYMEYMDKL
jgi:hypothetical protein